MSMKRGPDGFISSSSDELGGILLQCQRDLQSVRNQIDELPSQSGKHAAIYNTLKAVLERAENNLQDRANHVLKQATYRPLNTLIPGQQENGRGAGAGEQ
eukprot:669299-Amorphochlora_amoeboformis.AAC.1